MGKSAKLKRQRKAAKQKQKSFRRLLPSLQDRSPISFHGTFNESVENSTTVSASNSNDPLRPPIPEPDLIKYWFSHSDTVNWVLSQWNLFFGDILLFSDDASFLATSMLEFLCDEILLDLNHDLTVVYRNNLGFEMSIGLNVWSWTLWTSILDKSINSLFV